MPATIVKMKKDDWETVRSIYQEGVLSGNVTFEKLALVNYLTTTGYVIPAIFKRESR